MLYAFALAQEWEKARGGGLKSVSSSVLLFQKELIEAVENHQLEAAKILFA